MACVKRYAVGLIMLVFLEFALTSHNYRPDLKKFESVERSNQESGHLEHRQKRAITLAMVAAGAGIASSLFSIGKNIYGLITGEDSEADVNAKLEQAQMSLNDLKQKMAETKESLFVLEHNLLALSVQISRSLAAIHNGHMWLEGAIVYAADVTRLQYILHLLNQFSVDNATGSLQPAADVQRWAEGVTSISGRSIGQVLYSMHYMVVGGTHLFGNTPLITLVNNTLDHTTSDYRYKLQQFANFTINLQIAGYFAWITAENVLDRAHSISTIENVIQERFQEQSLIISLLTMVTAWPAGQYRLPLVTGDSPCPDPRSAWYRRAIWSLWCMRRDNEQIPEVFRGVGAWPAGSYCIFADSVCLSGFERVIVRTKLRDQPISSIANGPYCCRSDGSPRKGIFLPPFQMFSLVRKGGLCQEVMHMRVENGHLDSPWYPLRGDIESHPDIDDENVILCHYTPTI